jgi:hypothetical protein
MVADNIEVPHYPRDQPITSYPKGIDLSKAIKKGIDLLEDVEKGICPKGNQFLKSFLEGDQPIRSCPKGQD